MDNDHRKALTTIGLNILYYRKEKGYTQQQLAEMTSYSKNHIQQIETSKATPSVIALLDIAKALDIPVSKLFESR
ncbi:MAG: helix-turn-helix transcriptional regulator [Oscillospiraceae bacterium]|nr:helix-turn-helix transcriptional regulator [Oscillospiraceae bacterium]